MIEKKIEKLSQLIFDSWKKDFRKGESLVPYSGNCYGVEEIKAIIDTVKNGWFICGEGNELFEKELVKLWKREYCLTVNSGTSALMLIIYYIKQKLLKKQKPLNALACPACFPSTISALIQYDFNISWVDCVLNGSYNIDIDKLEEVIKRDKISLLVFAPVLGNPPDMDRIDSICKKHRVIWCNDSCDCLSTLYKGKPVGSYGNFSTLSLFPAHEISIIEGGAIYTDNEEDYINMYKLRSWARDCTCVGRRQSTSKYGKCGKRFSDWLGVGFDIDHRYCFDGTYGGGFNIKTTEIQAAIGLEQIKKIDDFVKIRKYNFNQLQECFGKYDKYFELPVSNLDADVVYFAYPIRVKPRGLFTRDELFKHLEERKIQTRLLFSGNILRHKGFKEMWADKFNEFPNSDVILKEVLMIGVSQVITLEMMDYMCESIDKFMKKYV